MEDWRRAKNCSRCLLSRENPEPSWPPWESELARSLGLRIQRFLPGSSNFRATAAANLAQIWPPPSPACRLIILFIGGSIVAAALTTDQVGGPKFLSGRNPSTMTCLLFGQSVRLKVYKDEYQLCEETCTQLERPFVSNMIHILSSSIRRTDS